MVKGNFTEMMKKKQQEIATYKVQNNIRLRGEAGQAAPASGNDENSATTTVTMA